ncbi:unnamed protein product [Didymodactylos carnosus]|uniref:Uncharacterized protein n=1 Tax=Didymodactylos carnosus TaxID=1234261 RepID=A0A814G6L1_9BILA|nr:unnamed protein product [Didymodactylos carnosus]CAF0994737.1 unnamed protein product [Didymodactylos carnosus]CAF3688673.1 unnamed protein product [Didymodactylos carnosus]CAF3766513.1 unnamed protein product [Didymodactylos carnosus]
MPVLRLQQNPIARSNRYKSSRVPLCLPVTSGDDPSATWIKPNDELRKFMEVKTFTIAQTGCDSSGQLVQLTNINVHLALSNSDVQTAVINQALTTWNDGYYVIKFQQPQLRYTSSFYLDIDLIVSMKSDRGYLSGEYFCEKYY